jgi:outer membrane protein W
MMIRRLLFLFSLSLLLPITAAAQMNELGVFASTSQLETNEFREGDDVFDLEFDEDMGVGLSYNRYWFGNFSTELAYQRLGADLTLSFEDIREDVGELDLDILSATAQMHFARGSMISPYIGGGVAYISGEAGSINEDEIESTDLEKELEFLANAGLDIGITQGIAIYLDGKYIMYEARAQGDDEDESIELNPLIIAGGVKFRF